MSELKNCPFCGGKSEIIDTAYLDRPWVKEDNREVRVFCTNCQTMTGMLVRSKAINVWNTRTTSPRFTSEEREAMETTMGLAALYVGNYQGDNASECRKSIATVRKMLSEEKP